MRTRCAMREEDTMNTLNTIAFVALCTAAGTVSAQTIGIDFGDINRYSGGNYNDVDHLQNPLFNLVDLGGNPTGIGLSVSDSFWPGSNTGGTTTPTGDAAGLPVNAVSDNLFGSLIDFGGFTEPTGGVTFSGMDPNLSYNFSFFASRMNVSDNREALYSLAGATNDSTTLDAANNTGTLAHIMGISPDANGDITLSVTAGPNNTSSFGFYYLGYVQITVVPAPASLGLVGMGSLVALRRRRR